MEHAVITGATGAIGVALVNLCINKNIKSTVLLNPHSNRNDNIPSHKLVSKVYCDMSQYDSLTLPEDNYDVFFHMAWRGTTGQSRNDSKLQKENLESTLSAVTLAKRLGCKKFVGIGSQAEYGNKAEKLTEQTVCNPATEYGKYKLLACQQTEQLCKKIDIDFNWVRILSVYGPYESENSLVTYAIRCLLKNEKPKYTPSEQIWDFLYSDDAAEALLLIAKNGQQHKIYVLGNGEGCQLKEYIKIIHQEANPKVVPEFSGRDYSLQQNMFLVADISELKKDVGFSPKTNFAMGVRKIIEIEGKRNEKNQRNDSLL